MPNAYLKPSQILHKLDNLQREGMDVIVKRTMIESNLGSNIDDAENLNKNLLTTIEEKNVTIDEKIIMCRERTESLQQKTEQF